MFEWRQPFHGITRFSVVFHMNIFQVIHYIKSTGINSKYLFFAYMYKPIFEMATVYCYTQSLLYPFSASHFPSFIHSQLHPFPASLILRFNSPEVSSISSLNTIFIPTEWKITFTKNKSLNHLSLPVQFYFLSEKYFFIITSMRWWQNASSIHSSPNPVLTRKFTTAETW